MAYDKQFMDMAIELAKGCALQDEVPVGCVVVKDGKVVGKNVGFMPKPELEAWVKGCMEQ